MNEKHIPKKIEIGVVIVTWNNEKDIVECLDSILNQKTDRNYQVLVLDNDSKDITTDIIKGKYLDKVVLIESQKNLYLTGGNNQGINYFLEKEKVDKIMVLNPDTICADNLIEELASALDKNLTVGAAGPKVIFKNGVDDGLINSAGIFYDGFMQAYDIGFKEKDEGQYNVSEIVFGVTGACIMYKVDMLKEIGLYWERIKLYMDEVELFIRARKAGWQVMYYPRTHIFHKYMQSVGQSTSYKKDKEKMNTWLAIAIRHYDLRGKFAVFRKYLNFLWSSRKKPQ